MEFTGSRPPKRELTKKEVNHTKWRRIVRKRSKIERIANIS